MNTKNQYPILIFMLVIPFFIIPVNADNIFINPDFETGDLTGWNSYTSGSGAFVAACTEYKHTGSYGGCTGINSGVWRTAYLNQTVDLTGVSNFSLYYTVPMFTSNRARIYINNDVVFQRSSTIGWTYLNIDTSSYSGNCNIKFESYGGYCYFMIDDLYGESTISNTTINFVPNVDETNDSTKPSFHYYVNDTDWSNYHELRIRQWRYVMVNNEWTDSPYTEWWVVSTHPFLAVDYQSYITLWPNTQDHTEAFHNWPYYFYPPHSSGIYIMKFEAVLYGADIYGSETILANDTMIYDSNYTYTPPPIIVPTAIPTANVTPIPTITALPTTTPTAIPIPDPTDNGTTNLTINKTGMQDFYDSVNGTIENLNCTINGVTDFFLIPTYGMTAYVNSVNSSLSNYTNQSTEHKIILSEIMIPFFYHLPLKVQLLVSYYLTLLLILIILER